jgi:hypothetical protein
MVCDLWRAIVEARRAVGRGGLRRVARMSDVTHERILRGVSRSALVDYLEDLGGTVVETDDTSVAGPDEDLVAGDGWQARLTQMEDFKVGPLSSAQVRLLVTGDPDEVRGMLSRLAPRLGRGGS